MDNLGSDIDGCLANFVRGFLQKGRKMGYEGEMVPHWTHWESYDPLDKNIDSEIWDEIENDLAWWLQLPAYDDAHIESDVEAYVTARSIPSETSRDWLNMHGFPKAPVHTVGPGNSKQEAVRKAGIETFVDDKPEHVREIDAMDGVTGIMLERPWNRGADVPQSILTLSELT